METSGLQQAREGRKNLKFDDLVKFVKEQAEIATDPVYGNDTEPRRKPEDPKSHYKGQYRPPRPRSVFSTTTKASTQDKTPALNKPCMYCRGDHTMEMCRKMRNQSHREKLKFLMSNGSCFACLVTGHRSNDCTNRLKCTICSASHPTVLHYKKDDTWGIRSAKY